MSDSDDSDFDEDKKETLVRNFEVEGQMILSNLLPKKSRERYEIVYDDFMEWCKKNKTTSFEENVLVVYFDEQSRNIKPSTIWSRWSMLRLTLLHRHNVDISKYQHLKSFLKNFSKGFKSKQAKTLTGSDIAKFLGSADDFHYLATKAVLIFGICGAARCCELVDLKVTDVEDLGNYFRVHIRDSKNNYPRTFVILTPYYEIVKKYLSLRPSDMSTNRFFIGYGKGKYCRQVIGKHKIAEVPKVIALYLNVEDSDLYTGHSLRRTGATLLSDSGASLVRIKNLGGWRSDAVAQIYIDNSEASKKENFHGIVSRINTDLNQNKQETSQTIQNDLLDQSTSCLEATVPEVDNVIRAGPLSEFSDRRTLIIKTPLQSVENVDKIDPPKDNLHAGPSYNKNSSKLETSENSHSPGSLKKRKLNKESNVYERHGPLNLYNCENFIVNINNYLCSHENCDRHNKD